MNFRTISVLAAILASVAFAACGDSSKDSASTDAATVATEPPATTASTATPATPPPAPTTDPKIPFPSGAAPTKLVVKDLKTGTGPAAKAGDNVTVNYVGAAFSDRKTFDSSFTRGEPFVFALGGQQVIPGWDQGVAGMKVGGRRLLVIPPDLGYGAQGQGPIKPNETLVFVVDLLSVS